MSEDRHSLCRVSYRLPGAGDCCVLSSSSAPDVLSSPDDLSERDPSSWRLQGSNDGKTWTDIHVVRGFFATGMRNARAFAK